jgi:integrase
MRSRTLTSKRDALALDADVKARKFKGEALPRATRDTLADAYEEWLRLRGSNLAPATLQVYKYVWSAHVRSAGFDAHRLTELVAEPVLIEELTAGMRGRGIGPAAQRKTLVVLSAVLSAAVQWKKIPTNPIWRMPKPPSTRQRVPHPFPPLLVERIKRRMGKPVGNRRYVLLTGDSILVSVLSYAGLRPGEALALTWGDVGRRTIAVDKAVANGVVGRTKTGTARSVPLIGVLREELDGWRELAGGPPDDRLVFPGHDGMPWSRTAMNNWRARVWRPTVRALAEETGLARLGTATPYDCRGSFVSLHLRAGASPLEVAAWAGHSPAVMFKHHANVIEELVREPRLSAEEQIRRARLACQQWSTAKLDKMVVDLFGHPTLTSPGSDQASVIFYKPGYEGFLTEKLPSLEGGLAE